MTLYSDMVAQMQQHLSEDETQFKDFIDTSKKLKQGLSAPESENQQRWNSMQQQVESFNQTAIGSTDYGDLLQDNQDYQKQMAGVSLDFNAQARDDMLKRYETSQQEQLTAADQYLEKNQVKP